MKKKRRVEIHIEHCEISIFASHAPPAVQPPQPVPPDSAVILNLANSACPTCGSPELILLTDALTRARFDVTAINQGMQNGRIHYHRSTSGEWWLCTRSLAQTTTSPQLP